jgi:hypothetical protein
MSSKYMDELDMGGALLYIFLLGGLHLLVGRRAGRRPRPMPGPQLPRRTSAAGLRGPAGRASAQP